MARKLPKPDAPVDLPLTPSDILPPDSPITPQPTGGNLPEKINTEGVPNVNSYLPTNFFDPASSPVPRTTAAQLEQGLQHQQEQKNSIVLLHGNLDNSIELIKAAVKSAKLVKLSVDYRTEVETIATATQKLRQQQTLTANESTRVELFAEQGRTILSQVEGQRVKTNVQDLKNGIDRLEVDYLNSARPVVEQTWRNKLEVLRQKAIDALNSGG